MGGGPSLLPSPPPYFYLCSYYPPLLDHSSYLSKFNSLAVLSEVPRRVRVLLASHSVNVLLS